jgi:hypothetical protein
MSAVAGVHMPAAAPPIAGWTFPEVEVGQVVHWFHDQGNDQLPYAAIVSAIGMRSITCNISMPDNYNFMVRDGVRHRDDPAAREGDVKDAGCWTHTDATLQLQDMRKAIRALQDRKQKD